MRVRFIALLQQTQSNELVYCMEPAVTAGLYDTEPGDFDLASKIEPNGSVSIGKLKARECADSNPYRVAGRKKCQQL